MPRGSWWPSATGCTRWCASPTGTATDAPLRSGATTSCSTSSRRASSPSPAPASPTTSSTRRSSSASRSCGPPRERSGGAVPPFVGTTAGVRLRFARRLRRRAPRRLRRSSSAPCRAAVESVSAARAALPSPISFRRRCSCSRHRPCQPSWACACIAADRDGDDDDEPDDGDAADDGDAHADAGALTVADDYDRQRCR